MKSVDVCSQMMDVEKPVCEEQEEEKPVLVMAKESPIIKIINYYILHFLYNKKI